MVRPLNVVRYENTRFMIFRNASCIMQFSFFGFCCWFVAFSFSITAVLTIFFIIINYFYFSLEHGQRVPTRQYQVPLRTVVSKQSVLVLVADRHRHR
jgi:hypothetical protein